MLDFTQFHNGATFSADLWVQDYNGITRHEYVDQLRAMLQPHRRPSLYIQHDGWLTERRAEVRGVSITQPIDRVSAVGLETSLQVDIPGGYLEDATQLVGTLRPALSSGGLALPIILPASFSAGASGSVLIINTAGTKFGAASTPCVLRLYGDCSEPVITNQTTGQIFELDGVSIAAGTYMQIDMGARTVYLNGDPGLSYYNYINFTTSSWWELQPGDNLVTISCATLGATAELDIYYNPRWAI
jgi:hypothetical protein